MSKLVNARAIAERVGVSISTVGRAISDHPRISEATKQRVRAAATELGYVGNQPARIMRGRSSRLIGLILPDIRNDLYAEIAQALTDCFDRQGHRLVLSIAGDDREAEYRHVRDLMAARVAKIIIVPTAIRRNQTVSLLATLPGSATV